MEAKVEVCSTIKAEIKDSRTSSKIFVLFYFFLVNTWVPPGICPFFFFFLWIHGFHLAPAYGLLQIGWVSITQPVSGAVTEQWESSHHWALPSAVGVLANWLRVNSPEAKPAAFQWKQARHVSVYFLAEDSQKINGSQMPGIFPSTLHLHLPRHRHRHHHHLNIVFVVIVAVVIVAISSLFFFKGAFVCQGGWISSKTSGEKYTKKNEKNEKSESKSKLFHEALGSCLMMAAWC